MIQPKTRGELRSLPYLEQWEVIYGGCICEDQTPQRWFTWKSQWFYSWPIKIVRGGDEFCNTNIGIVTWAGSIFLITERKLRSCEDGPCDSCIDDWLESLYQ